MNDPHVTAVHYNLVFGETINFRPTSASETYTLPGFTAVLTGQHLVLQPTAHFASVEEVLEVCKPLVKAWQFTIAIKLGVIDVRFDYVKGDIHDRAPTPGVTTICVPPIPSEETFGTPTVIRHVDQYPQAPDPEFKWTPDVGSLWHRYCGYKQGEEPLLAMAYFVLTVVEVLGGVSRADAAKWFMVSLDVLDTLGTLSTERGDLATARKLERKPASPLTNAECHWLKHAIPKLIEQVGRRESGPHISLLTLLDLPPIPPVQSRRGRRS